MLNPGGAIDILSTTTPDSGGAEAPPAPPVPAPMGYTRYYEQKNQRGYTQASVGKRSLANVNTELVLCTHA